jgi:hypothetical protein
MTRKQLDLLSIDPSDLPVVSVIPEIDNAEEELIGEAVLKGFVPGEIYFEYQNILNKRVADAVDKEAENKAIYDAQVWLLCQVYEVQMLDGTARPLGLDDVSFMEGEELAFRIAEVMAVNFKINFLDGNEDLKTSWLFEITDKAQRFRVQRLSVEKGVNLQKLSQQDPTGVKMTRWLITERITINDEKISDEDFKTKIDLATTVLLAAKINFLLATFQRDRTSFSIRNTRNGRIQT